MERTMTKEEMKGRRQQMNESGDLVQKMECVTVFARSQ